MDKKIIETYMNEVWNNKNLSIIDDLFSPSCKIHSTAGIHETPKEMAQTIQKWLLAIPDMRVDILDLIEEKGIVAAHWMARGTHQKELNGIPPKGNLLEYHGITMYRLENGKVIEYRAYLDSWALLKQMSGI